MTNSIKIVGTETRTVYPSTFEEAYEWIPGNGWLSREEAELLWTVSRDLKGDILEVGSYQGRSTVLLASHGRKVHTVDCFAGFDSDDPSGDKTLDALLANLFSRGLSNVTVYRSRIEQWDPWPRPRIGLAYLDGDHTSLGTAIQIRAALMYGAETIAIHDVNDSGEGLGVKNAALSLLGPWVERVGRLAVWKGVDSEEPV